MSSFGILDLQVLLTVRRLILESQKASDPDDALESALLEAAGYGVTYTAATQTLERAVHNAARPMTLAMPSETPELAAWLEKEMARHWADHEATQPIREIVAAWCRSQRLELRQLLPSDDRTQVIAQITRRLPGGTYFNACLTWDGGAAVVLPADGLRRELPPETEQDGRSVYLAASEQKFVRESQALAEWARQAQPEQSAMAWAGVA